MNRRDWWDALLRKKYPLGRKFCTKCGKWKAIHNFHADMRPAKRHPSGRPAHLRPRCSTCERIANRERLGMNPSLTGLGGQPRKWPSYRERNQAVVERRTPERKAEIAAAKVEWARVHRRGAGIPPRRFKDGRNAAEVKKWDAQKHPPIPLKDLDTDD